MSASKDPPHLPDVVDEAGDSPGWVPLLGLGLLCLVALLIAFRQATGAGEPPTDAAAVADGGVAGAGEGEAGSGEAPTAVPAAPAPTGDAPGHEGHGH